MNNRAISILLSFRKKIDKKDQIFFHVFLVQN